MILTPDLASFQVTQTEQDEDKVAYRRDKGNSDIYEEIIVKNGVDTVTKAFNYAVKKFGAQESLGTR